MISIHLFTRDLRSTDNPGFAAACEGGEVVPVFVLDDRCLKGVHASANRIAFLLESLTDLRLTLRSLGGELLVRRGSPARVVAGLAGSIGPVRVTVAEDVTSFSSRRERELRMALRSGGSGADDILQTYPGVTVVPVEAVRTVGGRAYRVFTPYWRAWTEAPRREVLRPPEVVRVPEGLDPGEIPSLEELAPGAAPGKRLEGGETAGRQRMLAWLADRGADYRIGDESLSDEDSSSRLGAYLHFGCVSPAELEAHATSAGYDAFVRELCWRDFNHQLVAAYPGLPQFEMRPRGDRWKRDKGLLDAWVEGRTGYPIVDAAMRQLAAEGWMHNRLRMLTASFLTKCLGVDWRLGAAHFMRTLVDGDLVNNSAGWQWVAGTGTDTRPNRTHNPIRQAERFDPEGEYVRTWVPELSGVPGRAVHQPWKLKGRMGAPSAYPPRIIDHAAATRQFLEERTARS